MPTRAQCAGTFGSAATVDLVDGGVAEASGVVPSPTTAGLLWLHNDSGDSARLFAVSTAGQVLGELRLPGVTAVDFEDLAAAPCPDARAACLWVADTGDNGWDTATARAALAVYAVREPAVDVATSFMPIDAARVWRFPFTAEGGPANVEAFVALPDASALVFYEKKNDGARILRLDAPFLEDTVVEARVISHFDTPGTGTALRLATSADLHPSGTRLLLRTYQALWQAELATVALDDVEQGDFVQVAQPAELQGEAACYDESGQGVWTLSEQVTVGGITLDNPLHHLPCAL